MKITEEEYLKAKIVVSEYEKSNPTLHCKSCQFIVNYREGGRVYCSKQKNNNCLHGYTKINRNNLACSLYESRESPKHIPRHGYDC